MVAPSEELKLLWYLQDVWPLLEHTFGSIEALVAQLEEQVPEQAPLLQQFAHKVEELAMYLEQWRARQL